MGQQLQCSSCFPICFLDRLISCSSSKLDKGGFFVIVVLCFFFSFFLHDVTQPCCSKTAEPWVSGFHVVDLILKWPLQKGNTKQAQKWGTSICGGIQGQAGSWAACLVVGSSVHGLVHSPLVAECSQVWSDMLSCHVCLFSENRFVKD